MNLTLGLKANIFRHLELEFITNKFNKKQPHHNDIYKVIKSLKLLATLDVDRFARKNHV